MLSHVDFQNVYDCSAGIVIGLDINGLIVYANPKAKEDLFSGTIFQGQPASEFFSGPIKPDLSNVEFTLQKTSGAITDVLISSTLYTDNTGLSLTYWIIRNISPLKKKEDLLAYLNTVTEELSRARDTRGALDQISRLIVPKFATWFSIDLIRDNRMEELVLAHENPEMIQWARRYREIYPIDLDSDSGTARVAKTGEPSFFPMITEEMIRSSIKDP